MSKWTKDPDEIIYLNEHLDGKNDGEHIISDWQEFTFSAERWYIRPFHRQRNAIQGDKKQHQIVEPLLVNCILAFFSKSERKPRVFYDWEIQIFQFSLDWWDSH